VRIPLKLSLVVLLALVSTGCDHHYRARFKMTWECTPKLNKPEYPNAQTVRLRFVQDPAYFQEISGRVLCDQLKASSQSVVNVEYEMWGESFHGLHGFHEVSIDGRPIVDAGASLHLIERLVGSDRSVGAVRV